ncbi:MAG TPA: imidazolonepropionase [Candidatus Acidoferrum sp.]
MSNSLLISGASQIVTMRGHGPRRGDALSHIGVIRNGAILVRDGVIVAVGPAAKIEKLKGSKKAEKFDVGGLVLLPGFVDAHTHLIHAASRAEEYELKICGASYEEIARKGGGILNSVKKLRAATAEELKTRARGFLERFAEYGTTTIEAKSGYGLDGTSELRILSLHKELDAEQPLEIVSTFLGAHVVPAEYRGKQNGTKQYLDLIEKHLIPEVAENGLAEFCDVFCERGAFSRSEARRVLGAGKTRGLAPRVHAEQLSNTGATRLGIELDAASCDHLEYLNAADIRALGKSDTVATLLPGCDFHLGLERYAPARKLIDAGAIVALATDFNPGTSPTLSMAMILSLACSRLRMTPAEAIAAATINAAFSLRREKRIGSIERGKQADLAVFEVADYREIPYYFGVNTCWMTMKRGEIVYLRD